MEKEQALRILNALANGVHPATGEKFAADSPYQHPDTVRALFEAMRAVEGGAVAAAPAPAAPAAAAPQRKPAQLPQSGSGFEARLVRLGKMDASAVTTPLRYPPKPAPDPARQSG
jgi:hypothetical protein